MKIHIVKKGDTLWKIAEMYDVDFEELKQMNEHLAHPDMIMPGMKIRVPVHKKEMKKEHKSSKKEEKVPKKKETQMKEQKPKEEVKKPQPLKPMKEIKEDDSKDHIHIQPVIPFEQQKSPSLNNNTMPKMPSMPDMPHLSPPKEEKKEIPKEIPKEKPVKKKEQPKEKKVEYESFPLTSHGCHCYCGTCTPMHFAGSQIPPQVQQPMPMHMMYPSQSCGCNQTMMQGSMHHPMHGHHMIQGMQPSMMDHHQMNHPVQENHLMQGMYPMQPSMMDHHQMMYQPTDGNYMQQPMMQENAHQPMSYYESDLNIQAPSNQQMPPQQQEYIPESWQREEAQIEVEESIQQNEEQPVRQSYPSMYSEQAGYYSYPQPPEFINEE